MTEQPKTKQFLRIFNTAIEGDIALDRSLIKIKGLGPNFIRAMCIVLNINPKVHATSLTETQTKMIEEFVKDPVKYGLPVWLLNRQQDFETGKNEQLVNIDLKLRKEFDIKRHKRIKSYRGIRHGAGLPVRGQRTKAHFRKGRAVGVKKPKKGK